MSHTVYKLLTNDDLVADEIIEVHEYCVSTLNGFPEPIAIVSVQIDAFEPLRLGLPLDKFQVRAVLA
ncbi:hypothetical protein M1M07_23885 [Rhodococcus sp. HM1]|uniref:hypothetical protein n=1 Tax=Rhodococcus sp. HM1 TaxID=2937759 RepID=UPI00200B35AE|nr:hypothetical protein [Rhodococcus sp. HM1]MCK8674139.1 hypothetical protein [Rhodococcus sp. HM1]